MLKAKGAENFGIHAFLASNTVTNDYYPKLARILFELAVRLERETGAHVAFINLSGGVGIPYLPEQQANDIHAIGEGVHAAYDEILVPAGMGDVAICTEMGRFMMGPYGCLVTKAIHEKQIYKDYIGVDASAVDLIRPAMYGVYHHITVMGQPGGADKTAAPVTNTYDITGNLCENNDKFAIDRELPQIDMGDVLVIHDTGAHGYSMGYNYNGRLRSAEVLLRPDGSADLIRRAERPGDYFATLDVLPSGRELLAKSRAESARRRAKTSAWQSPPNGTNASRSRTRRRRTWTSAILRARSSPLLRRLKRTAASTLTRSNALSISTCKTAPMPSSPWAPPARAPR